MYTPVISSVSRSPIDQQVPLYQPMSTDVKSVDLRVYTDGIEFQDDIGTCTANAVVSACEIFLQRDNKFVDLSRLFVYYNSRDLRNQVGLEGAFLSDALYVSKTIGICPESFWPYSVDAVDIKPSEEAYQQAQHYKIIQYQMIDDTNNDTKLSGVRSALVSGLPVVITMAITTDFEDLVGPIDQQTYLGMGHSRYIGLHAMNVVGYDDEKQYLIVENSWGSQWGDNGYFALSYPVMKDVVELWVVMEFVAVV